MRDLLSQLLQMQPRPDGLQGSEAPAVARRLSAGRFVWSSATDATSLLSLTPAQFDAFGPEPGVEAATRAERHHVGLRAQP